MLKITGLSDDIVSLSGDIDEEIDYLPYAEEGVIIAVSSGHAFKVEFTDNGPDGRWEVALVAGWDKRFAVDRDGADGDDTATVNADVAWAIAGAELHRSRKRASA